MRPTGDWHSADNLPLNEVSFNLLNPKIAGIIFLTAKIS
jgi:hypothetical protein